MDKKIKIILDSNHIYKLSSNRLISMIDNYNKLGDTYIPEVVIDELVQRDIDYIEEVNFYKNKSVVINNSIETKKIEDQLIGEIRLYYSNLFNNKVIKLSSIQIDQMYNRALVKKPPFIEDKNASDKGFKDSLIWVSILEDSHTNFDEVIFLSSDNSFIDNKDALEKEFFNIHDLEISFLRQLENKRKIKTPTISPDEKEDDYLKTIEDFKKLESLRENLDRLLDRIVNVRIYNDFGEYYKEQRFSLFEKLEDIPLEKLMDNLNNLVRANIMRNTVSPSEFLNTFGDIFLFDEKEDINTQDINDLNNLLYRANFDLAEYSESIVKAIIEYINNNTFESDGNPFSTIRDDELPF